MPLLLDPDRLPVEALRELAAELRTELTETLDLVRAPGRPVRDPASLATAEELVRAALATLDRPGPRDRPGLAADVNLAYAALVASIDLVKSHTDGPTVPQRRSGPPTPAP
jgi:hypothetical protein